MIALVLASRRDRLAIAAIAFTAALSSAMEAALLVIITLAGFRLSGDGPQAVSFPLDLPLDDLSTGRLLWVGALLLALRLGATFLNLKITAQLSSSLLYRWRRRIVRAFLAASWEEQQREQDGHLQTVTQTFVGNISAVAQQLSAALTALTSFLTFVVGAFALNPIAALGLLIFGAALSFLLKPMTIAVRRLAGRDKAEGQEYARQLGELATAATEIRVFGRVDAFEEMLDARQIAQIAIRKRQVVIRGLTPQLFQTAGLAVVLAGLGVAISLALDDAVLVGALVLLLIRSLGYGQAFQANYQSIAGSSPYVDGVVDALERYEGSRGPVGTRSLDRVGALRLSGVCLGYGEGPVVLPSVDMVIQPGQAIGLIGPSGAGKSTLVAALLGLLPPLSGSYEADGVPVAEVSRDSWSRLVAFVPQEPKLFEGSVGANIDFYRGHGSAQVRRAALDAHLGRELDEWEQGLDRQVGPRGSRLSGGQKQRVCIARALLGAPEVLVLDEPTSALDNDAEDSITDVLRDLRGERTLIVVAHRLTTLEFCDRVFMVDAGQVVEIGSGSDIQNREDVRRLFAEARVSEAGTA